MVIADAKKVAGNFKHYMESLLRENGPVVITEDDVPVAAIVRITDPVQLAALIHSTTTKPLLLGQSQMLEAQETDTSAGPTEAEVIGEPRLLDFYLSQIKPHLLKVGRVYTTSTPDIRVGIPGRKKASVFAMIRKRKNSLKLYVRVGKGKISYPRFSYDTGIPDLGLYDLHPSAGVPAELDDWLQTAHDFTDKM